MPRLLTGRTVDNATPLIFTACISGQHRARQRRNLQLVRMCFGRTRARASVRRAAPTDLGTEDGRRLRGSAEGPAWRRARVAPHFDEVEAALVVHTRSFYSLLRGIFESLVRSLFGLNKPLKP